MLDTVRAVNDTATFNRWAGFEVVSAADGRSELRMAWRAEMGQYAGFLHVGMIGALLDTACGFAAATVAGQVMASNFSMSCLAPAAGHEFVARGQVVRAGRKQVFTTGELFARGDGDDLRLVAIATTILVPSGAALAPA